MAFSPPGFPGTGPSVGTTALDGPPPSPTAMGDMGGGFSMRGIAGPGGTGGPVGMGGGIPSSAIPPEILTGVTQSAQTMDAMLDSFMQVTPNKGAQLQMIKQMLQQYLADLMTDGGGATTPTATGPAFPGGGMDRGLAGAGAI